MNKANHKDDCPGTYVYSGSGYNRVRVCACGAEDHAPEEVRAMTEANTGCARNQGTTQFCAEAVEAHKDLREAQAEIKRLKADFVEAMELLRTHGPDPSRLLSGGKFDAVKDWNRRYGELLLKHLQRRQRDRPQ